MPVSGTFRATGQSSWFRAPHTNFAYGLDGGGDTFTINVERKIGEDGDVSVIKELTDGSDAEDLRGILDAGSRKAFFRFNCSAVSGSVNYLMQK